MRSFRKPLTQPLEGGSLARAGLQPRPLRNLKLAPYCAALLIGAVFSLRADLGPWVQHLPSTSTLRGIFFRDAQLPGGLVPSRRPPRDTVASLTKLIATAPKRVDLHRLRAHEAELNLDFTQAEASWKAYGSQVELADYYHRRLDVPKELDALLAANLNERALQLAFDQALPPADFARIYRAWIAHAPDDQNIYRGFADHLLKAAQYTDAESLAFDYAKRFPTDDLFPVRIRAEIAEQRGSAADALSLYDVALRPLSSPAFVAHYFQALERARQLRAFFGRAMQADPASLDTAARLFYYYQQAGRLPDAHRALLEFAGRKRDLTLDERLTLATLFQQTQNYGEAARHYHEAWKAHGNEQALAGVIGVLFDAPEHDLGIGGGDLTFYRDIATIDPYPGTLNGTLSLLFNTTYPKNELADQERAAVPYFHRAKAAELIGELEKRFPQSEHRTRIRARLIQSYATYGANDAVTRLGREYLTAFPQSPHRTDVALSMADALARLNRLDDEFRIYDELLKELAAAAKGKPLGTASDAIPEIATDQNPAPGPPPPSRVASPDYARVLDRYLSRLTSTKRIKEALAVYRSELDRNPNDPGLYERFASFLAQNRMAATVAETYGRAMKQFQDRSWHHKLARWYLRRQQTAAFSKLTRDVTSVFSGSDLDDYFSRVVASANLDAVLYRELNRFAHQRFPHDLVFVRNLLTAYQRQGTADAAAYEALLRRHWYYDAAMRAQLFQLLSRTGRLNNELAATTGTSRAALQLVADGRAWQSHFEDAVKPAADLAAMFPGEPELNARCSSLFRSFGRTDEAVRAAERISQAMPRDRDNLARLGDILAEKDRFDEAARYWNRIPAVQPGNPEGYLEAATVYWDWFRYDDALRVIGEARTRLRNPALFAYEAGAIHENKRDYAAAVTEYVGGFPESRALRRLVRLAGRPALRDALEAANPVFSVRVAILEEQNRRDDLRNLLTQTLRTVTSMDRLQEIDNIAQRNGFPDVRELTIQRQIAVSPDPVERLRLQIALARMLEDRRELARAAQVVEAVYKQRPEILGVVRATVDYQWRAGQRDRAVDTLEQSAKRSNVYYRRGFLLEAARKSTDAQDYNRARRLIQPLLTSQPAASDLIAAMADTWARAGEDRQLREFYAAKLKEVTALDSQTSLRRGLIPVLTRMKDHRGALEQYIETARRFPDDEALTQEASAYARRYGLADELIAWYTKAERESPKDARWPVVLARVLTHLEKPDAALEAFTRASTLRPDRTDLLIARASLEDRLMRFEQSASTYARLYDLTYRDPSWMVKCAEARARLGQKDAAVAALRKAFTEDRPAQPKDYLEIARQLATWNYIREAKQFADRTSFDDDPSLHQWLRVRLRQPEWTQLPSMAGQPGQAVDAYYTPEEKTSFAATLAKTGGPQERQMVARGAGLHDVLARELARQVLPETASALIEEQQQRAQFEQLAQTLEAAWKATPPQMPNRDMLLQQAAESWRFAGNAQQELRVFSTLMQTSGGGEWLSRYIELLRRSAPQHLVALAQTGSPNVRNAATAATFLTDNPTLALKAVAARGTGLAPVWTKAYTALTGVYFGAASPEIFTAFDEVLGPRTVGAQLAAKLDRNAVLAGDNWFPYASRYGEFLDTLGRDNAREYLAASAESRPASAASYLELAEHFRDNHKTTQAIEEYRSALQVNPTLAIAHARMAALVPPNEAATHLRQAFTLWNAMQNGRLPATFWSEVTEGLETAARLKLNATLRPEIDRVLRTYIRRTGTFRVRELLRAASPDVAWIVDLSAAAPVRSEFLLTMTREPWIAPAQRETLFREILEIAESEVASRTGESRSDALWRLRNARFEWIESLLEAQDFTTAAAALGSIDREEREATAYRLRRVELTIAATTGTLDEIWAREEIPEMGIVSEAAAKLRQRGDDAKARELLRGYYRLQLDRGSLDVSTFLGLADVILESGERDAAVSLLNRMRIVAPEPFQALRPASQLLQRFKHTKEAQTFLEVRVRAVPWDTAARGELAALTGDTTQLRAIASDPQTPYAVRAEASSKLKGVSGLGSQELDLLASGQPIPAAAAERPYFFHARMKAPSSVRLLRGALAIRPESIDARLALFRTLRDAGDHAAAVGVFEPFLRNVLSAGDEPREWIADSFLREYPDRMRIATELADSYRRIDNLNAARALLFIAKSSDASLDAAMRVRAENQSRHPFIHEGLDQPGRVRPRLTGGAQ